MYIKLYILYLIMCGVLIASLNLNGARDRNKRAIVFETFKQKKIDVALV